MIGKLLYQLLLVEEDLTLYRQIVHLDSKAHTDPEPRDRLSQLGCWETHPALVFEDDKRIQGMLKSPQSHETRSDGRKYSPIEEPE